MVIFFKNLAQSALLINIKLCEKGVYICVSCFADIGILAKIPYFWTHFN